MPCATMTWKCELRRAYMYTHRSHTDACILFSTVLTWIWLHSFRYFSRSILLWMISETFMAWQSNVPIFYFNFFSFSRFVSCCCCFLFRLPRSGHFACCYSRIRYWIFWHNILCMWINLCGTTPTYIYIHVQHSVVAREIKKRSLPDLTLMLA